MKNRRLYGARLKTSLDRINALGPVLQKVSKLDPRTVDAEWVNTFDNLTTEMDEAIKRLKKSPETRGADIAAVMQALTRYEEHLSATQLKPKWRGRES